LNEINKVCSISAVEMNNAAKASHIQNLLTPKWMEFPQYYKVKSSIRSEK